MKESRIISEQTVFQSKYFKVEQVVLERNEKQITKDIVQRNPFVIILPLTENDEVYLVKQYRDALQKVSLEVVAGTMDEGEESLAAGQRELQEETGLIAKKWTHLKQLHVSANIKGTADVWIAEELQEGERNLDEDEEIDVVKMPLSEALKKIDEGEIDVSSNIASLLLLDRYKRGGKV